MENDLHNSVIYSEELMINSWNTFVTILKEYGITEWGGGDKIEDADTYSKSKYVYTLKNGRFLG